MNVKKEEPEDPQIIQQVPLHSNHPKSTKKMIKILKPVRPFTVSKVTPPTAPACQKYTVRVRSNPFDSFNSRDPQTSKTTTRKMSRLKIESTSSIGNQFFIGNTSSIAEEDFVNIPEDSRLESEEKIIYKNVNEVEESSSDENLIKSDDLGEKISINMAVDKDPVTVDVNEENIIQVGVHNFKEDETEVSKSAVEDSLLNSPIFSNRLELKNDPEESIKPPVYFVQHPDEVFPTESTLSQSEVADDDLLDEIEPFCNSEDFGKKEIKIINERNFHLKMKDFSDDGTDAKEQSSKTHSCTATRKTSSDQFPIFPLRPFKITKINAAMVEKLNRDKIHSEATLQCSNGPLSIPSLSRVNFVGFQSSSDAKNLRKRQLDKDPSYRDLSQNSRKFKPHQLIDFSSINQKSSDVIDLDSDCDDENCMKTEPSIMSENSNAIIKIEPEEFYQKPPKKLLVKRPCLPPPPGRNRNGKKKGRRRKQLTDRARMRESRLYMRMKREKEKEEKLKSHLQHLSELRGEFPTQFDNSIVGDNCDEFLDEIVPVNSQAKKGNRERFQCWLCSKTFALQVDLVVHQKRHLFENEIVVENLTPKKEEKSDGNLIKFEN